MHRSVGQALGSVTLAGVCLTLACGRKPHVAYRELQDHDPRVRADMATRLGEARIRGAVDSLVALLDDPHVEVRVSAIRALGEIGDPRAVPAMIEHGSDPSVPFRTAMCRSLGQLEDPRAVPLLGRFLRDMDDRMRLAAAKALADIPGRESADALVGVLLRDESETIQEQAAKLLRRSDATLVARRIQESVKSGDDRVRANAARALGELADRSSISFLIEALDDPYHGVRSMAAQSLVELAPDDAAVREALERRMSGETQALTQVDLAWSLARLGNRSHVDRIRSLLFEGSPEEVRAEAAMALGDVGDETDLARLEKALQADASLVRREAYVAIQKLKRS